MKSINDFFEGFTLIDFFIIFVVADVSRAAIFSILVGPSIFWGLLYLSLAVALWKFHIWLVKNQIKNGMR